MRLVLAHCHRRPRREPRLRPKCLDARNTDRLQECKINATALTRKSDAWQTRPSFYLGNNSILLDKTKYIFWHDCWHALQLTRVVLCSTGKKTKFVKNKLTNAIMISRTSFSHSIAEAKFSFNLFYQEPNFPLSLNENPKNKFLP